MTDTTDQQLPINAFAGIFLTASGLGVLILSGDLLRSALFFGVGLFFLMRALAQHRHGSESADEPTNGTD
jgi:hypothetical protein